MHAWRLQRRERRQVERDAIIVQFRVEMKDKKTHGSDEGSIGFHSFSSSFENNETFREYHDDEPDRFYAFQVILYFSFLFW